MGEADGHGAVRHRGWPAVAVLVLALSACGGDDGSGGSQTATGDADLAGKTFVSTEVFGLELADGTEIRVTFESDRISVQAGCNTLFGSARWDGGVLAVDEPMGMTRMACSDDLMRQDDWLHAFLTSEPRLSLDGSTLTLGDSTEGIVLDEQ
jgi:heat shock protein HslJ